MDRSRGTNEHAADCGWNQRFLTFQLILKRRAMGLDNSTAEIFKDSKSTKLFNYIKI